jgi:voltage-gated potassium channel
MSLKHSAEDFGLVQLLSLVLSILILVGLAVEALVPLSASATHLLDQLDFVVCLFFLADFFHRLFLAPSKLAFLKWGWIDFVSSLPVVGVLQLGRIARILRILRVLRLFRSSGTIWNYVAQ